MKNGEIKVNGKTKDVRAVIIYSNGHPDQGFVLCERGIFDEIKELEDFTLKLEQEQFKCFVKAGLDQESENIESWTFGIKYKEFGTFKCNEGS